MVGAAILLVDMAYAVAPANASRVAPRVARTQIKEDVKPTEISEKIADMSGAVYGLVAYNPNGTANYPVKGGDPTVFIGGLGRGAQRLCIQIKRAQGGYSARFSAMAPPGWGAAAIPFDSSPLARSRLSENPPGALEMAIHATVSDGEGCPASTAAPLLPAGWTGASDKNYTLLVGGAATGVPATRIARGSLQPCKLVSQILQRSDLSAGVYAYSCQIPLPSSQCTVPTVVTVLWFKGSRLTGSTSVSAKSPCEN